ncbi:MAG: hypothetical protein AUI10_12325 [Actinobacteria bacterium 13_2_20CM_2_72_6]|nr:MAG: hypothetical protein AUI10_12325 [Actinobacteria bacterium 13_2_20CM_2_72_6]
MFGGHVPEHGRPRSKASWLVHASALLLGVLVLGTAFIASYVGALHEPHPRSVPIAVVEDDPGAQALISGLGDAGPFAVTSYPDAAAAARGLADRAVYGILDTDPAADGLRLTVAGGAAPGVADLMRQVLGTAATAARIPLSVRDAHPPAARDPRGLTPFYLVVGWLLGGYLAATALAVIVGTVPRNGSRLGMRLAAFAVFAVLLGLAGALITGPGYGIWSHHLVSLWSVGTLVVFTSAAVTAALESWLGLAGTGLAMLLLFIVGNPGSGGVYPPEFLPGLFRDLHRWIPTGQATELVRAVEYFGGHAIARPATTLAAWAAAGLLAILGATLALGPRRTGRASRPRRTPDSISVPDDAVLLAVP